MSIAERLGLAFVERGEETPAPFCLYDEEELRGQFDDVTLGLGSAEDAGRGILYLTTRSGSSPSTTDPLPVRNATLLRRVLWLSTNQRDLGYCLSYPAIVVHAITVESSFRPGQKCLYLQLEPPEEEEEEDDDLDCCLTIVPEDGAKGEERACDDERIFAS